MCFGIHDGRTEGRTDGQTDREINPVWASLTTFLQLSSCHSGWYFTSYDEFQRSYVKCNSLCQVQFFSGTIPHTRWAWAGGTNFPVVLLCHCVSFVVSDLLLWREIVFSVTYELRLKYKMGCRNRYSEGRNPRQMTPRGNANLNSYVKNLHELVFQTDREIDPVWASLTTFLQVKIRYTRSAWAGGNFLLS